MKKIFAFLFLTAMMLLLCNHLNAQNIRISSYQQAYTFASVNGASVLTSNLYVLDSVDAQYNSFHIASFDINVGGIGMNSGLELEEGPLKYVIDKAFESPQINKNVKPYKPQGGSN